VLKECVKRIRKHEAALNKGDVKARYLIGVEVRAIHREYGDSGVERAAKLLVRWSAKALYEYEQVAETWDAPTFEGIRTDAGPQGNVLSWSDFVGLSYVKKEEEREKIRKQALEKNKSIKTLRRQTQKPKPEGEPGEGDSPGHKPEETSTPESSFTASLCKVQNDAPLLGNVLKTILVLLDVPTQLKWTPAISQLLEASADALTGLRQSIDEVVSRLRPMPEEPESGEATENADTGGPVPDRISGAPAGLPEEVAAAE
jgi:hypothetical protein